MEGSADGTQGVAAAVAGPVFMPWVGRVGQELVEPRRRRSVDKDTTSKPQPGQTHWTCGPFKCSKLSEATVSG